MPAALPRRVGRAPLLAAAVLGVAGLARPEVEAVALDYEAPPGCPDRDEVLRRVQERTPHARAPRPGELARRYRVRITGPERAPDEPRRRAPTGATEPGRGAGNGATPFRAVLSFTDRDGQPAERVVEGASCREAADAIALVTALAIQTRVEAEGAVGPGPSASASAPAPSASVPAPGTSAAPPPEAPLPVAPVVTAPDGDAPAPPLRWSLSGAAVGATGVAPGLAWGPWVGVGGWSGAVAARLGVEALNGGLDDAGPGLTSYRLTAAVGEGCRRWALGPEPGSAGEPTEAGASALELHGCAVARVGELRARALPGAGVVRAADRGHLWGSLGLGGRAEWWAAPVLAFGATLGAEVLLNRREFYLTDVGAEGPRAVHALPPLALRFSAGITLAP